VPLALLWDFNQSWLVLGAGFEALRTGGTPEEFESVCRKLRLSRIDGHALAKVWRAVKDGQLTRHTVLIMGWRRALGMLNKHEPRQDGPVRLRAGGAAGSPQRP